jgi:hypothetical protein
MSTMPLKDDCFSCAPGPWHMDPAHMRESVCCLLVLNLVSSQAHELVSWTPRTWAQAPVWVPVYIHVVVRVVICEKKNICSSAAGEGCEEFCACAMCIHAHKPVYTHPCLYMYGREAGESCVLTLTVITWACNCPLPWRWKNDCHDMMWCGFIFCV